MALLHRLRGPGARGLIRLWLVSASLLAWLSVPGCDAPADLQPDAVLQDSLGLSPRDRVHLVALVNLQGLDATDPDSVLVGPGDWVDFRTRDAHPRVVRFLTDSVPAPARDWLDERGLAVSPPLAAGGVHWTVPMGNAPPGRYPFVVEGSGRPGRGAVFVSERR